jgi:hypothetical protein
MDESGLLLDETHETEDYLGVGLAEESDDDGLESFAGTDFVDELFDHADELGNDVVMPVTLVKDEFKIKHSRGSFKLKRKYAAAWIWYCR